MRFKPIAYHLQRIAEGKCETPAPKLAFVRPVVRRGGAATCHPPVGEAAG
jgi:hypothetical protein